MLLNGGTNPALGLVSFNVSRQADSIQETLLLYEQNLRRVVHRVCTDNERLLVIPVGMEGNEDSEGLFYGRIRIKASVE
jgi:hypothetical protein